MNRLGAPPSGAFGSSAAVEELTVAAKRLLIPIVRESDKTENSRLDITKLGPAATALESKLRAAVIGQVDALDEIVRCYVRYRAGLVPSGRPVGVFLLVGPTGTGKTHLARSFSKIVTANEPMRIDCAEFQLQHEVARLVGAPPGYLGHRETSPLLAQSKINAVKGEDGLAVILLDEIDKAHPSLIDLFLGIFDSGLLRLADNTTTNFENVIFFMTSNKGSRQMQEMISPSFGMARFHPANAEETSLKAATSVERRASRDLRPEMLNRLDKILVFAPLTPADVRQILNLELAQVQTRIEKVRPLNIVLTNSARELLLDHGYSQKMGARELKRTLGRELEQPIANLLVSDQLPAYSNLLVRAEGDQLSFQINPEGEDGDGI